MSRKMSSGLKRVVGLKRKSFCGFCFDKLNAVSTKSFYTQHIIRNEEMDEEIDEKVQTIECLRCGFETFFYPKLKATSKTEAARLKARFEYNKHEVLRRQGKS